MATKNLFASLFGESPETQQARQNRDMTFQGMLSSRRQATQQNFTDNAKMARWNALGNVLTTMVQPLGWAAGGATGKVQKYDDRQYIDSFNRAVKASDDLRNIGNAEAEYNFKLAEQDYNRLQSLEDAERQQQRIIERQELAEQGRMERDQKKYEHQLELQQRKDDAKMQLEQYKQTHKVTKKGTGLTVEDRILLKEIDAYNKEVAPLQAAGKPYDDFSTWMGKHGYQVDNVRSAASGGSSNRGSASRDHASL